MKCSGEPLYTGISKLFKEVYCSVSQNVLFLNVMTQLHEIHRDHPITDLASEFPELPLIQDGIRVGAYISYVGGHTTLRIDTRTPQAKITIFERRNDGVPVIQRDLIQNRDGSFIVTCQMKGSRAQGETIRVSNEIGMGVLYEEYDQFVDYTRETTKHNT